MKLTSRKYSSKRLNSSINYPICLVSFYSLNATPISRRPTSGSGGRPLNWREEVECGSRRHYSIETITIIIIEVSLFDNYSVDRVYIVDNILY